MTLLAFDTSTTGCSAALVDRGHAVAWRYEEMDRGQAERLLPMIDEVMTEAGIAFEALDLVATTTGPGAFTGLRIGLSAAQGIALAAGIPGFGVSTFDALMAGLLASGGLPKSPVLVCIESKRADVFVQLFDTDGQPLSEPDGLEVTDIGRLLPGEPVCLIGDAAERALAGLEPVRGDISVRSDHRLVDARPLGILAEQRFFGGVAPPPLTPIYMRPPDAKVPKDGGRLRPLSGT